MYVDPNFKTKKALKEAVQRGEDVSIFDPGPFNHKTGSVLSGLGGIDNGTFSVEGPHYPEPHRWYARVQVSGGRVVKVS
jgi:hypothetical protein